MPNQQVSHKSVGVLTVVAVVCVIIGIVCAVIYRDNHPYLTKQLSGNTWEMETIYKGHPVKKSLSYLNVKSPSDATLKTQGHAPHAIAFNCSRHQLDYGSNNEQFVLQLAHQGKSADTFDMDGIKANGRLYHPAADSHAYHSMKQTHVRLTAE